MLWDVGAGAGSVAIEWMLIDPLMRAIAIEARADRSARIARNAAALGVPDLGVREGMAPAALAGLPTPDAIFIGGGARDDGMIAAATAALASGGRLAVNAVTTETEALLLARQKELGGELVRIAIARASPIGRATGWRTAMPVTQWIWVKA
jgi:precorrin-6Y C5,15-methyltransferase (decarboxylating)